jgi:glycerol-1-phosphate dehydrogenase [NAD(P)+]
MNKIERALQRTTDTKDLVIGPGVVAQTASMFQKLFPGQTAIIIADTNTWEVAGKAVLQSLENAHVPYEEPFIFDDPDLYAEWKFVEQLKAHLSGLDAIAIAVGSGVINDLTKYTSHVLGRKYMCVGTAASMDGYTAYGASITKDGNKQTFSCPAPYGFVMDPVIAAAAPKELAASGYADLIAKIPAGADWMIAESIGVEPIDPFTWDLVQRNLRNALSAPDKVKAGNVQATEALAEGLIMSGFAMQALQSSRPASGAEHQYSHFWDMDGLCINGKHVSHGFKVGIGTLVSTASLEFLIDYPVNTIDIERAVSTWPDWDSMERRIRMLFEGKPAHLARALKETRDKYVGKDVLRTQLETFIRVWPELREKVRLQIYSFDTVYDYLKRVGAPDEPELIGISRERLRDTFRRIPYMRSRFTNADIIRRLGIQDELENHLFGPGGHWEIA